MLIETLKTMLVNDELQNNDIISIGEHNGRETEIISDYLVLIKGDGK